LSRIRVRRIEQPGPPSSLYVDFGQPRASATAAEPMSILVVAAGLLGAHVRTSATLTRANFAQQNTAGE